jgi:hypothetical protein
VLFTVFPLLQRSDKFDAGFADHNIA